MSDWLDLLTTPTFEGIAVYFYALFFIVSIIGGLVGSLSGGAGMITMPLLLVSGLNPLQALATNKFQACIGSFTSAAHYYHQGLVDMTESRAVMIIATLFGALGAILVQFVEVALLSKILPFVMIIVGAYFLFSPKISEEDKMQKPHRIFLFLSMAGIGLYGGFLGIGIGPFILALLVSIGGYGLSKALAHSRWVVFSTNIASTLFFVLGGNVLWILGSIMCVGQVIGASFGARLTIKHGAKIIRPIVICVCFALSAQLLVREFL
ncbi:TSUP family transporter [Campylobacter sp. MIT 21-1685]|uniref:TSUP family transporter n=1 Tax=unclassified Campylobacter TaxID=2593542 RepID=UPI00224B7489|nr:MULTISPECIES: TSUP family transporter [unclassified Campylobacter]MCX2683710.1 TSUP family transporter [Campylobacter sp. MIT 21-1684]MCX2751995.1 TSUP family transporter [Campylobacter sp. MIT 21-1682]MCX2808194.1 TSUP family transporter [Campylobacter sp. MIT 21-1685]